MVLLLPLRTNPHTSERNQTWGSPSVTAYTYRGLEETLAKTVQGSTTMTYAATPSGTPLAQQKNSSASSTRYFLQDPHSDLVGLVSSPAASKATTSFDPWGTKLSASGTETSVLGFQSDLTDPDSALVDMGTRWYVPSLGRFASRDVLFGDVQAPVSLNMYVYAGASPVSNLDPTGMKFIATGGGGETCYDCAEPQAQVESDPLGTTWASCALGGSILAAPTLRRMAVAAAPPAPGGSKAAIEWFNAVMDVISSLPVRGGGQNPPGTDGFESIHPTSADGAWMASIFSFKGKRLGYTVGLVGQVPQPDQAGVSLLWVSAVIKTKRGSSIDLGQFEIGNGDDDHFIDLNSETPVGTWQGRPDKVVVTGWYGYQCSTGACVDPMVVSVAPFSQATPVTVGEVMGPA